MKTDSDTQLATVVSPPTLIEALDIKDNFKTACELVDQGADIGIKSNTGWTVLHFIARDNLFEFLEYLHAKQPSKFTTEFLVAKTADGKTPLEMTIIKKSKNVAKMLLNLMDKDCATIELKRILETNKKNLVEMFGIDPKQNLCEMFEIDPAIQNVPSLTYLAYSVAEFPTSNQFPQHLLEVLFDKHQKGFIQKRVNASMLAKSVAETKIAETQTSQEEMTEVEQIDEELVDEGLASSQDLSDLVQRHMIF